MWIIFHFDHIRRNKKRGEKMELIRMENENGIGPFHGNFSTKLSIEKHEKWINHSKNLPCPEDDNIDSMSNIYHCAAIDKNQLMLWFKDFLEDLYNEGFRAVIYSINDDFCKIGYTQVIFVKENAKKIRELSQGELIQ